MPNQKIQRMAEHALFFFFLLRRPPLIFMLSEQFVTYSHHSKILIDRLKMVER